MRALIVSITRDPHALAVKLALEQKGHQARVLYPQDFPTLQSASFRVDQEELSWSVQDGEGAIPGQRFDAVWLRRVSRPHLPEGYLHPSDRPVAQRECDAFSRALLPFLCGDAFVVNPLASLQTSESKLLQLRKAREVGLRIPRTLVSNEPAEIASFIRAHGDVLFKTLTPNYWEAGAEGRYTYASRVTVDDLPPPELLRATPGIFQAVVEAERELRVTAIGDHLFCGEVASDGIDYRRQGPLVALRKAELPPELARRLRALMAELGLVFGCFDLLVDRQGGYIFLEVNPVGQWLWKELVEPELLLLDAFTELLIQGRPDFVWSPERASVRYRELLPRVLEDPTFGKHLELASPWTVHEDRQQ